MKAQVFTTTRSASSTERAGASPSESSDATTLSESTAFFGQPRVSIQKREAVAGRGSAGAMTVLAYRPGSMGPRLTGAAPRSYTEPPAVCGRQGGVVMSVPNVWCPSCGAEYTLGSRYCSDCRV